MDFWTCPPWSEVHSCHRLHSPLVQPSSRHLIIVVTLVRPSRTHHRLYPIRYHTPLLACSYCLLFNALERPSSTTTSESAYGISIRHLRTTGCTLAYATATDVVDGRAGSTMVGGAWHSWLGFWREWLGRAHLSGMYPSLLHNRGFDACSTCSLHLVSNRSFVGGRFIYRRRRLPSLFFFYYADYLGETKRRQSGAISGSFLEL